ncbi:MAG: PAS domain S-box protein [Bacteroidales bacterium]|nr:PAS domain S-box protein [Bacteroidales bacterium]MBN2818005.1 PAS domain S-box protein [Bacteroidales bacterium]
MEHRLKELVSAIQEPFIVIDSNAIIITINQIAEHDFNFVSKDLIGKNLFSCFCPIEKYCNKCYLNNQIPSNCILNYKDHRFKLSSLSFTIEKVDYFLLKILPVHGVAQNSELSFRSLIGMLVTDSEGKIQFADEHFCSLTCQNEQEIEGKSILHLFPEEAYYLYAYLKNPAKGLECDIVRTNCEFERNHYINIDVLQTPNEPEKYFWLFHEIKNEELKRSRDNFQSLFKEMVSGFVLYDVVLNDELEACDLVFNTVNPAFEKLMKIDADRVVGKSFRELIPEYFNTWIEIYNEVLNTGRPSNSIKYIKQFNKYFEYVSYIPEQNKFALVFNDVTQNVQSRFELDKIFELSTDLICILDKDGNLKKVNPAFSNILGYDCTDLLDSNLDNYLLKAESGNIRHIFKEQLVSGETIEHKQNRFISKDGRVVWLSWTFQPLTEEQSVFAFGRDITTNKEYEYELIKAKELAEEGDKLKSAFLANMSHEVRTPMNAIIGFATLLDNEDLDAERRKKYIEIIRGRCDDLLRIIDDILDISKIEASQLDINPEPFSIKTFLNEALVIHNQRLEFSEKTSIRFSILPIEGDIMMYTDKQRLMQVLNNLVDNAIKFTLEGSINIGVKQLPNNKVQFSVTDTGIGIPPEKFDLIFQRFRQAEENLSRKFGGNGLGLAICKPLIELMGGKIWLESVVDVGSTFYFTIEQDLNKEQLEIPETLNNISILIVEDDRHSINYLRILLEQFGTNIIHARSGYEALKILKDGTKFDLIIMDIQLTDINGLELTQAIREFNKEIPIIAETAFAQNADRETCLTAGCNDYITKPIDDEELLALIGKHIKK